MTMFVLEDFVARKYATGDQSFGTSWMLSSDSRYRTLKHVIVYGECLGKQMLLVVKLSPWKTGLSK